MENADLLSHKHRLFLMARVCGGLKRVLESILIKAGQLFIRVRLFPLGVTFLVASGFGILGSSKA